MNLNESWADFVQDKQIENYSPNTIKAYEVQKNVFHRFIGDIDLEDIDIKDLKNYIILSKETLKSSSVQHRIKFLRSFFRWAHEEGYTTDNKAKRLKFPKEEKRLPKHLLLETIEALKLEAKNPLEELLIEFLYTTGIRIGELHSLDRKDIDLADESVTVIGKGNKERKIYFSKRSKILIERYYSWRKDDEDCFIATMNRPHKRMKTHQLRLKIKKIAERAGVEENVSPHFFRHSFATYLIERDVPLDVIQYFLGHASPETTKIYAYVSTEKKKQIYKKHF